MSARTRMCIWWPCLCLSAGVKHLDNCERYINCFILRTYRTLRITCMSPTKYQTYYPPNTRNISPTSRHIYNHLITQTYYPLKIRHITNQCHIHITHLISQTYHLTNTTGISPTLYRKTIPHLSKYSFTILSCIAKNVQVDSMTSNSCFFRCEYCIKTLRITNFFLETRPTIQPIVGRRSDSALNMSIV